MKNFLQGWKEKKNIEQLKLMQPPFPPPPSSPINNLNVHPLEALIASRLNPLKLPGKNKSSVAESLSSAEAQGFFFRVGRIR